ncbi:MULTISPECIES: helix-turn-helix transcriptional regulator [Cryobacterium]|uniref:XRE family transcriptional regulator n=1 Tax=Cryobacterium breve TaxID=1259258 RepID=A0ABY2J1X5_9MICO|nr:MULTISPECIES: helix-turn-helix transcriptional regulator [Cryobacterium]TFC96021.1 XRE family transcriptional regulator [Cryobacterium sp. TmT3-12]TFC97993.1 XRE family transcriptional regulator [Cryobacterium breve]
MVQRRSVRQQRMLKDFGAHLKRWRTVNNMAASDVADRASVTRETLRNVESGTGTARMDSLFAILAALGILDEVVEAANPYNSEVARVRIDEILRTGGTL